MSSPRKPPIGADVASTPGAADGPGRRESQVLGALVDLADALGPDFDVLEMMAVLTERAVELLAISAAGVLLVDTTRARGLTVAAASTEDLRLLEVFAVELSSGPGVECVRSAAPVCSPIIEVDAARWPRFARAAVEAGYRAVHALPMRLRGEVVGALTLLHHVPHPLADDDRRLGQALADAATIGLLSQRAVQHAETVSEQIGDALRHRVVVEHATGMLAQQSGLRVDEASAVLRDHARRHHRLLSAVCAEVVAGALDLTAAGAAESRPPQPRAPAVDS